jgi:hypothetical protein
MTNYHYSAQRAQGYRPDFLRKHGTGDGRFYGEVGVTAVAFGVGGHGQHGADEFADITTIAPYYQALRQFLQVPWAGGADGGASRLAPGADGDSMAARTAASRPASRSGDGPDCLAGLRNSAAAPDVAVRLGVVTRR